MMKQSSLYCLSKAIVIAMFVCPILIFPVKANAADEATFQFRSNIFIRDWLVCGPFPKQKGQDINTDFLTEHGGETGIHPSPSLSHASTAAADGRVSWQMMRADESGKLDFRAHLSPNEKNVVYAAAIIESDKRTAALLKTGSNDRLKLWFNGKLVYFYDQPRASGPDVDQTPVVLQKGKNLLLAKVDQEGGAWWLYARFQELIPVDEQLYILEPVLLPLPKKLSDTSIADIFSVLAFNTSDKPSGPISFEVQPDAFRKGNRTKYETIRPGRAVRLIVESEVKLQDTKKSKTADIRIASAAAEKEFRIATERSALADYADLAVYIVPHSHADLSWPDTPEASTNRNVQAIAQSIDILKEQPDFKFTEEDVFVMQEFLRRNPGKVEEVKDLLRRNILQCGGFYFGPSELLLGGEGLVRNLYFGKLWLLNTLGVNTNIAWNVDAPGHTLQMPQILAKAGIDKFVIWKMLLRPENQLNVTGYVGPSVFRWQAPDGSRIMVAFCPQSYSAGEHILRESEFLKVEKSLLNFIEKEIEHAGQWEQPPVIMLADGSDCSIPDIRVGRNAELWNEKYRSPEIKLASTSEYFQAVENAVAKGRGKISTVTGEMPCWWAGTQSVENDAFMLARHAEYLVTSAEKFSAVNNLLFANYDYPRLAINNVWQGKLWVHEHNWGGTNGDISDAIKLARARETYRLADDLVATTLDTLMSHIRFGDAGIPIVAFNSLAWQRNDIVDHIVAIDRPGTRKLHLVDAAGVSVPVQIKTLARHADGSMARAQVLFEAQVPSLGYATYYLVPGTNGTRTALAATDSSLENQFYKIAVDPRTGGITSIYDKLNQREILDTSAYQGNELIALENLGVDEGEEFTDKYWRMNEKPATVALIESGPIRATIRVEGGILNADRVQEISLYATLPRIDLKTTLNWDGQKKIQVNAAFPFDIEKPRLTYEVPFGSVQYGLESETAQASHPTVRATNNWIDLSNDDMGVTLATEVTPFDVKDRLDPRFHDARHITGEWPPATFSMFYGGNYQTFQRIALRDPLLLDTDFVIQPILLRSVFSCGDQNLYFTQEGEHVYRFAIRTHAGPLAPHQATRFGLEHNAPLLVKRGESTNGDLPDGNLPEGNLPDVQSFLTVSAPNVVATILKKAEDGSGLILRCFETDGKEAEVTASLFKPLTAAQHTNIIEQEGKDVKAARGQLTFRIGPHAIETYKMKVQR